MRNNLPKFTQQELAALSDVLINLNNIIALLHTKAESRRDYLVLDWLNIVSLGIVNAQKYLVCDEKIDPD